MLIEIIDVSAPTPVKKYFTVEVAYKSNGKVQAKKLVSYSYPQAFKDIQSFKRGDLVEVTTVKEGEFWQWTAVAKGAEAVPAEAPRDFKKETTTVKSNYETSEERAARQVLIVRQSSLSAALNYLELVKNTKVTAKDVMRLADEFTDWVFNKERVDEVPAFDIESDII